MSLLESLDKTEVRTIDHIPESANQHFLVGDWVEVRSKDEILRTLDKNGQLEGLPFMPEMFYLCGRQFRVYKSAHKTCDTVHEYKARSMKDAVHLENIRCDGQSHGGCEASCLIFWKTAWLRKVDSSGRDRGMPGQYSYAEQNGTQRCTENDVLAGTRRPTSEEAAPSYVCQATQIPAATEFLPWWVWNQYFEDYASGNVGLARIIKSFAYIIYRHGFVNLGIGIGPVLMWLYDRFQSLRRGTPYPHREGKLPVGARTPASNLDLQPGEWVRVKSLAEIRATCNQEGVNRGMKFDAEMVPYCGGTYQVLKRVTKIVNEKTGELQELKNPCIILDSVVCQARFADCRLFCPRSIYPYWRECWLERVDPNAPSKRESELVACS